MKISALQNKQVCIIGFGKEGQAMCSYLEKYAITPHITIADVHPVVTQYPKQIGTECFQSLDRFDVLIVSPGVVPCKELDAYQGSITTMSDLFVDSAQQAGATVIGVTGSKGKSTVTSLIYEFAKTLNVPVYIAGNIGVPSIELLPQAAPNTVFVVEMSSYQLGRMHVSPQIAVITSFFPDHLDYYAESKSARNIVSIEGRDIEALNEYKQAKMQITKWQTKDDFTFYDTYTTGAYDIALQSLGTRIATSTKDALISIEETKLIGQHNLRNVALATKVAQHVGVTNENIITISKSFTGLKHRLEHVGIVGGIEWIDDAISTTPESTIAALEALEYNVDILFLGGKDRHSDFTSLAQTLAVHTPRAIVLLPENGEKIRIALEQTIQSVDMPQFYSAPTMQDAVAFCYSFKASLKDDSSTLRVVLSTASPSYGLFKNFEDKGDQFVAAIHGIDTRSQI